MSALEPICSIPGCERGGKLRRAMCDGHYARWQKGQRGETLARPLRPLRKRTDDPHVYFWTRVDRSGGPDACWEWQGAKQATGYGNLQIDGRSVRAHRLAWSLAHGPVPDGMLVCHRCDNRPCCNPAHLFLGTHAENLADMAAKGRSSRGSHRPATTLTVKDVRGIRARVAAGEPRSAVARDHGISNSAVSMIVRRKTWKHVR